jgi:cytochrome c
VRVSVTDRYDFRCVCSGLTWDEATFTKYIVNPRAVVPGTRMTFAGLKNETDIANLLAYLKTFGPDGQPAP